MRSSLKNYLRAIAAFVLGAALMASVYLGFLTWVQGWGYAWAQLERDRAYVVPIILAFGIQAALYAILRWRLFVPNSAGATSSGAVVGTNGAVSTTSMVACCLHHVTNVLPILGVSAAAGFLARYQRPFMLVGLAMNMVGILVMLLILDRARRRLEPMQALRPVV